MTAFLLQIREMASSNKLQDSEMENLLTVDRHQLYSLTNSDLNLVDKQLYDQKIITNNEFYQLRGSDRNVRM